jgi:hypothetical protein
MIIVQSQILARLRHLMRDVSWLQRMAMPALDTISTPAAVDAVVLGLLILLTALI